MTLIQHITKLRNIYITDLTTNRIGYLFQDKKFFSYCVQLVHRMELVLD